MVPLETCSLRRGLFLCLLLATTVSHAGAQIPFSVGGLMIQVDVKKEIERMRGLGELPPPQDPNEKEDMFDWEVAPEEEENAERQEKLEEKKKIEKEREQKEREKIRQREEAPPKKPEEMETPRMDPYAAAEAENTQKRRLQENRAGAERDPAVMDEESVIAARQEDAIAEAVLAKERNDKKMRKEIEEARLRAAANLRAEETENQLRRGREGKETRKEKVKRLLVELVKAVDGESETKALLLKAFDQGGHTGFDHVWQSQVLVHILKRYGFTLSNLSSALQEFGRDHEISKLLATYNEGMKSFRQMVQSSARQRQAKPPPVQKKQ